MNRKLRTLLVVVVLGILVVSVFATTSSLARGGGENDKSGEKVQRVASPYNGLSLFIYLGFLLLVLLSVIFAIIWLKRREIERYEDAVEDLKKQLDEGKISEGTYKQLRLELEEKYDRRMKRMGFG